MIRTLLLTLTALAAMAADDGWTKVKELKTGSEVRILKKGARQAIIGIFDEANDERLVIVVKNEQSAIAREDIDRLDARPIKPASRIIKDTRTTNTVSNPEPARPGPPKGAPSATSSSTSSTLSLGNKPDFENIYRRAIGAPKK